MRGVQVYMETRHEESVLAAARDCHAATVTAVRTAPSGSPAQSVVLLSLANETVGPFVAAVEERGVSARFVVLPSGALLLETPLAAVNDRVREVTRLSTLELAVASLQSIGSWQGLVQYSVLAGIIGAYGLIFDAAYVLVAAMLINPMGAPALVAVVATSIGDVQMFGRGAVRFILALLIQAVVAMLLGAAYGLGVSTPMMEQVTALSLWGAALAFAAGAAGAQAQVQSDRDSLVSGTASGFMVAAALAPPAAVLGLAVPLGRWDYAAQMLFLLALQFVAIVTGGWLALRLFGVRPKERGVRRGTTARRGMLATGAALAAVILVIWQRSHTPQFLKADLSRDALVISRDAVNEVAGAAFVESTAAFTRASIDRYDADGILMQITVEGDAGADEPALKEAVRRSVGRLVEERMRGVIPFVDVVVLPPPGR